MLKLWEIDERITACVKLESGTIVDTETGEIIDEAALAALEMERTAKLENIALWYKNELAEANAIKAEKLALEKRRKAAESKAERIRLFLADYLGGEKFKTPRVAINWRASEVVDVQDWTLLPDDLLRYKAPEADKAAIKKALQEGREIAGAELISKKNIIIK